jgi:hypothetical protein
MGFVLLSSIINLFYLFKVAESQRSLSPIPHMRICTRIHQLLDAQLNALADMLYLEGLAVDALADQTSCHYVFSELSSAGLNLTTEPFFRGMLMALHKYQIGMLRLARCTEINVCSELSIETASAAACVARSYHVWHH